MNVADERLGDASVAALILAGGGSRRLGRPKQLLPWGDVPLLEYVVKQADAWPVGRVLVVLGDHAEEILAGVDFGEATVVINPEWEEGLASSLRVGLDALTHDARVETAVIGLGDQPTVPLEVVERLVDEYRRHDRPAVVPKYRFVWGNPVVVARSLWSRFMSLEGDAGAKRLLQAHSAWVHEVLFDRLPPRDVDTAADADELRPRA